MGYTMAILTSMIIIICVCCVGVLSFYCIMQTNKRLNNIMKDDDDKAKKQQHAIPNSSKGSSLRIDLDNEQMSNISNMDQDMLTVNKLYQMEPGISTEIVDENKEIELTLNDNAMTPSEGLRFYEEKYNKVNQQQFALPNNTSDCVVDTMDVGLDCDEFIVHGDSDEDVDVFDTEMCGMHKIGLYEDERMHLEDMASLSSVQYEGLRMKHRRNQNKEAAFYPPLKKRYSGHHNAYSNHVSR